MAVASSRPQKKSVKKSFSEKGILFTGKPLPNAIDSVALCGNPQLKSKSPTERDLPAVYSTCLAKFWGSESLFVACGCLATLGGEMLFRGECYGLETRVSKKENLCSRARKTTRKKFSWQQKEGKVGQKLLEGNPPR